MKLITEEVKNFLGNSSMIRRMFEAGIELKKQYGAENVYDFSLGNPDLPPPTEVKSAMAEIAGNSGEMFAFGYMPNAGSVDCREALAKLLKKEQDLDCAKEDIIVTCGAAGGINAFSGRCWSAAMRSSARHRTLWNTVFMPETTEEP